jgi:nicotinamide-nucleotide amidase
MPSAEIISIGTELLLGEIVDTNARFLARALREIGVDLYRKTTVGDNAKRIANVIREGLNRADIILTTGGLGPTVDDPTREAVALAVGRNTEFRPELWEQIQSRFRRYNRHPTENNKRQAYIPEGSIAVENPVGTAPAFIVEFDNKVVATLPGVPREMEYLMIHSIVPYLQKKFTITDVIMIRILHTAGLGESQIDDWISDLETMSNPTVGLSAHSGQVDVRITAKADSTAVAQALIEPIEVILRERLGKSIYGTDQETLENAAMSKLRQLGWTLAVCEAGLGGELVSRLAQSDVPFMSGEILQSNFQIVERMVRTNQLRDEKKVDVALGVFLDPGVERQEIYIDIITPLGAQEISRPYGGPPESAPRYAANHSLDILRNL